MFFVLSLVLGFMSAKANKPACEPQITHQIVYQSVEAPQIEPLDEQEIQSKPFKPIFTSYDLVRGKSAGVLIQIDKSTCQQEDQRTFDLKMYANNKDIVDMKCLDGEDLSSNQNFCSFSFKDFETESLSLFIRLPMGKEQALDLSENDVPIKIDITEKTKQSVISSVDFKVNVIATNPLSIALVPMTTTCPNDKLKNIDTTEFTKSFLSSTEVKEYLPYIFPLAEVEDKRDLIDLLSVDHLKEGFKRRMFFKDDFDTHRDGTITIRSKCSSFNSFVPPNITLGLSIGMTIHLLTLSEMLIESYSRNRFIMLISDDYMNEHYANVCGFVPVITIPFFENSSNFYKLAVISDECMDKGSSLHELAHTIGQGKEFYEGALTECQQYKTEEPTAKPCYQYIEYRGLHSSFKETSTSNKEFFHWKFWNLSIMNSASTEQKWIDRESYQKIFNFLKIDNSPNNVQPYGTILNNKKQEQSSHIRLSAIYDKQSKTFVHFQNKIISESKSSMEFDKSLYTKNINEDFKYIKFTLLKKNEKGNPYITVVPQDMDFRVLHKDGGREIVKSPYTPVLVSLPIEGNGDFELSISTGILSKEGEMKEDKQIKKIEFKQPETMAIM